MILEQPMNDEQACAMMKDHRIKVVICVGLEDLINCNGDEFFNDFCEDRILTGIAWLSDIKYKVAGHVFPNYKNDDWGKVLIEVDAQIDYWKA